MSISISINVIVIVIVIVKITLIMVFIMTTIMIIVIIMAIIDLAETIEVGVLRLRPEATICMPHSVNPFESNRIESQTPHHETDCDWLMRLAGKVAAAADQDLLSAPGGGGRLRRPANPVQNQRHDESIRRRDDAASSAVFRDAFRWN